MSRNLTKTFNGAEVIFFQGAGSLRHHPSLSPGRAFHANLAILVVKSKLILFTVLNDQTSSQAANYENVDRGTTLSLDDDVNTTQTNVHRIMKK